MDLVNDDRLDAAEDFPGVRSRQQVERLGGGDEDVRRVAAEAGALGLRGVAGARGDLGDHEFVTARGGYVRDAGQRRAEVALDVDSQGLERRDVNDPAAA